MKYIVTHGETSIEMEITPRDDGSYHLVSQGQAYIADLRATGGHSLFSLMLDDHSYDVAVVPQEEETRVTVRGWNLKLRVESEQEANARLVGGAAGPRSQKIKSPMPGIVSRVQVAVGDEVEAGQALAILEAMKMENEIRAHAAGSVKSVHVEAGQTVNGGDPLFDIA